MIEPANTGRGNLFQFVVFKMGGEKYALRVEQINEVVITPVIIRMPQTPSYIKGVIDIRGMILPVLDLEEKFSLSADKQQPTGYDYTVVIENDNFSVGLLVHEVPTLITVTSSDMDASSNASISRDANYVKGVIQADGEPIFLMDIFKIPAPEVNFLSSNTAA